MLYDWLMHIYFIIFSVVVNIAYSIIAVYIITNTVVFYPNITDDVFVAMDVVAITKMCCH